MGDIIKYHCIVDSFMATDIHAAMRVDHSTDDQIFFVLHSYIMLIRLLWTLCWTYDTTDMNQPYFDDNEFFSFIFNGIYKCIYCII